MSENTTKINIDSGDLANASIFTDEKIPELTINMPPTHRCEKHGEHSNFVEFQSPPYPEKLAGRKFCLEALTEFLATVIDVDGVLEEMEALEHPHA